MLAPTLNVTTLQSFADDYQTARHKFLGAMKGVRMAHNHRALSYAGQGPLGESLLTDVVWLGATDATQVLVLISGTHGVEGFAGSAIQIDLLQRIKQSQAWPANLAILLIHALNPFGFAWLRRCNEEGIDLNRNFVDFTTQRPSNAGYAGLSSAIVPDTSHPSGAAWQAADQVLADFLQSNGQRAYELAVSGGQFSHPNGLFFGGHHPSRAREHIEMIMADWQLAERQLAVIDLHTGLGPFGYGEIICDHPLNDHGVATAERWYGDAVTLPAAGTSTSVPKQGLLDYAWHALMNRNATSAPSSFVTLEFGTYPIQSMFQALRRDHWLHARGPVDWHHPDTRQIKAGIRKQFYPDTSAWQAMVLFQGRQTVDMAIRGMLSD